MIRLQKEKKRNEMCTQNVLLYFTPKTLLLHIHNRKRFYEHRKLTRLGIFSTIKKLFHVCQYFLWLRNLSTFVNLFIDWVIFPRSWIFSSIEESFLSIKEPFHKCEYFSQTKNFSTHAKFFFRAKNSYIATIKTSARVA